MSNEGISEPLQNDVEYRATEQKGLKLALKKTNEVEPPRQSEVEDSNKGSQNSPPPPPPAPLATVIRPRTYGLRARSCANKMCQAVISILNGIFFRSTSGEEGTLIGHFQLPEDRVLHQSLEVIPIAELAG